MGNKKKIYVAGSGGMLGEAFYKVFSEEYELKCTDIDLNENWLSYMDFRDMEAYKKDVEEFSPDYLFHLGTFTDLEYCENNIKETYKTNTLSVEKFVSSEYFKHACCCIVYGKTTTTAKNIMNIGISIFNAQNQNLLSFF